MEDFSSCIHLPGVSLTPKPLNPYPPPPLKKHKIRNDEKNTLPRIEPVSRDSKIDSLSLRPPLSIRQFYE